MKRTLCILFILLLLVFGGYVGSKKFSLDPTKAQPWVSPAIAFFSLLVSAVSVRIAILEARKKAKEAQARADEAKKYVEALETVIKAGQYMQYLQGVDANIGNAAKQLESIALRSKEVTELASRQIEESVGHMQRASKAAADVADQAAAVAGHLSIISSSALRAQRDRTRDHERLMREIVPPKPAPESHSTTDDNVA